jgi:type VI protein secretion system component VasK
VFAPGAGKFWKYFQETVQPLVLQSGAGYTQNPAAPFKVSGSFLAFVGRASAVSRSFYPGNAQKPAFTYVVQSRPSPGVEQFSLSIDGKRLNGTGAGGPSTEFTWTGDGDNVQLSANGPAGNRAEYSNAGIWAPLRLLSVANRTSEGNTVFEYDLATTATIGKARGSGTGMQGTLKLRVVGAGGTMLGVQPFGCVGRITP